jgi:molybdate transport repressor ModE-like protein
MGLKRAAAAKRLAPRAKVWLELNGEYVFGLGLSEMLKAVQDTGSIKRAAQQLGKSYRHVWSRIKEAECALGAVLVASRVGGQGAHRSELTGQAQQLVADYDALRQRVFDIVQAEFATRFTVARPATPQRRTRRK